ncbi:MAG: HAD-IA family hydrolase [Planctomycetaceae bacterium]|nr:HAD-IA family hydrolase [Planctomycetaceae bacterium]
MQSQIRCIAFDAVGTLIYPDPPVAEVYARVGRKYGATHSESEVRERFLEAFRIEYENLATTSESDERQRWRRIVHRVFELEDGEACFEELFHHFGQANSWRCFPEVEETLQTLATRGQELVLASNFDRRLHAICEGHPPLRVFETRIISSEVGSFKPHAGFYNALLEKTKFASHEVLMVGDDWENDVLGAAEMGLQTVFLNRKSEPPISNVKNIVTISSLAELTGLLT